MGDTWILECTERGKSDEWDDSARHAFKDSRTDRIAYLRECEAIEASLVYRWRNTLTGEIEMLTDNTDQPTPKGKGREIMPLVIADLVKRTEKGVATYGEPLRADNGRDALRDAYEEALDLAMYLRQAMEERK